MLKRILTLCLASFLLLVMFAVPVVAAVPEDQQSMVNFLDYTLLDGATATLYSASEGDLSLDCIMLWDDENKRLTVTWEDTFTADNMDDYYLIFDYTYQEVAPHLSAYAYSNGAYYGSAGADISYSYGYFGNTNFESLSDSTMSYEDLMQDNVVFIFTEAGNLENLTYFEYPAIYQDYNGRLSELDSVMWSGESYYFWTPYNEEYFLSDNTDGSYDEGYEEGYEAGLNKFVDDLALPGNIFSYATYEVRLSFESDLVYTGTIVPDITNSFVSFYNAINRIGIDYTDAKIIASWSGDYVWVYGTYQLGVTGLGDADNVKINDLVSGNSYYLVETDDSSQVVRPYIFTPDQIIKYPVFVNSMEFYYTEGALANSAIVVGANDYNNGYNAGFASGVLASNEDVYNNGFRDGREEGYIVGKAEGLSLADRGDWRHLFTAVVEAPLHVFNSLFNFEVLGLDMRDFMASMFTLCLVVLVLDKFLGGI